MILALHVILNHQHQDILIFLNNLTNTHHQNVHLMPLKPLKFSYQYFDPDLGLGWSQESCQNLSPFD